METGLLSKDAVKRRIVTYEIFFFSLVCLTFWLNEILDIPHHLFGAESTPVNWIENIIETIIIAILCASVVYFTLRIMVRLKYLEGFLPVCSYCRRIKVNGSWILLEKFLHETTDLTISHGYCPDCIAKYHGDVLK